MSRRRGWAALFRAAGFLLLAAALGVVALKGWSDWRWTRFYRSETPSMRLEHREETNGFVREMVLMEGFDGETIPVRAALPEGPGPFPAVVFLYGSGMDMGFALRIDQSVTEAGFALFVPEQFHRGRRKERGLSPLREALAFRRRCFLTGAELRRTIDAVAARPDVDPERIYYWGASFGAITPAREAAREERIKAIVFTLAGGRFSRFLADSPVREEVPRWGRALARPVFWIFSSLDPVHHVGGFAPRPFLLQNALRDDLIPPSAVEALYAAAGEPRELRWYDVTHNYITAEEVALLIADGLEWLSARDRKIVERLDGQDGR